MTLYAELGNTLNMKNKMIREGALCLLESPKYSECNVVFALSYIPATLALGPTQPLN